MLSRRAHPILSFLAPCTIRYDADNSGTIDKEELALVLHHLGEGVDAETLDALMEEADDDGNGEVGRR